MSLSVIYHFQSSRSRDGVFKPASYKVIHSFSSEGFIEEKILHDLSKSVPEADHQMITFLNLDDLKYFALRVAEELDIPEVRLISVQDYNIGLDGARDLESYQSIFDKFGEVVVNESASKKRNFFGKFRLPL